MTPPPGCSRRSANAGRTRSGVAERARLFGKLLPDAEFDLLVAAAYLHDIGYAPQLARTAFHALHGARFLRALGCDRLACLVAHHSGARAEAHERGLVDELDVFTEERSLVADALTYSDPRDRSRRVTHNACGARLRGAFTLWR